MTDFRDIRRALDRLEDGEPRTMELPPWWNPKGSGPLVVDRQAFKQAWIESASEGSL